MIVCVCNGVSERDIQRAMADGCRTLDELAVRTGCGSTCGCCREMARELLREPMPDGFGFPLLQVA
jgi:bacterioferritin-associated ferredoxin